MKRMKGFKGVGVGRRVKIEGVRMGEWNDGGWVW